MAVRVSLAGKVSLGADGAPGAEAAVGRLGQLALAFLVTERHRPVEHDELAEVLWGEDRPKSWETSLRVVAGKLRALLGELALPPPTALVTSPGCYQLVLPAETVVDTEEALAATEAAETALRAGRADEAGPLAAGAAAVAARPFLAGVGGPWAERRQAELRQLRARALAAVSDAGLATGSFAAALAAAEEALALEPFAESAHRRVIAAHAAAGNRAEALRAYERCRRLLAEELGVPPSGEVQALYEQVLLDDQPPAPPPARPPAGAPLPLPATTFVGRQEELAEVHQRLRSARLLTLLGTGGVGKTRLALEAASRLASEVAFVELAPLTGPDGVAARALAALGLREMAGESPLSTLAGGIGDRPLLLVLDNCEHLVEASAQLAGALLAACPALRVLATSREPLGVAGETTWRVPSLAPPDAMALFVDRARQARPDVAWPEATAALAQVCRRLDGIPLALELAAARTRALSVEEIADRLDDRFRLLTGGARTLPARHQTLRAAVDWTYQALPEAEARLFDRLSVFAGPVDLAAVEQVCAGGQLGADDVLPLVAGLVDRSLLVVEEAGGRSRYRLLETLRQYGRERLEAGDDGPAVRDRHLAWALDIAASAGSQLRGPGQARGLVVLEAAHDDLRASLTWAINSGSGEAALVLAGALGRFWEVRGHFSEGRAWLQAALDASADSPTPARARALEASALLAQHQGDYGEAAARFSASLAVHRELGHDRGVAAGLHGLGNLAALRGDLAEARSLYEETLALGRRLADEPVIAATLTNLGSIAQNQGDLRAAWELFEESLALRRRLGDEHEIARLIGNLGYVAFQAGDRARARAHYEESLAGRRRLGDRSGTANSLCNLGYLALVEGDRAEAARLLEASLALAEEVGDRQGVTLALARLARLARAEGDYERARSLDFRAMPLTSRLGAKRALAEWLEGSAGTAAGLGCHRRAARLLGAAARLREAIGAPLPPSERATAEHDRALVEAGLGPGGFADAWAEGRALSLEQAMAEAVAGTTGPPEGLG